MIRHRRRDAAAAEWNYCVRGTTVEDGEIERIKQRRRALALERPVEVATFA